MARAAFLDRDGVINRDRGYVHRVAELEFLPGAIEGLRLLQQAGYLLIVVTNQSGVARGLFGEHDYISFTKELRAKLLSCGVGLTDVYQCFHLEDAPIARYAVACNCRKPKPGMVLRGLQEHHADAKQSVMIGDRESDIQAGRAADLGRCYLVGEGNPTSPARSPGDTHFQPDANFASLFECARHVTGATSA